MARTIYSMRLIDLSDEQWQFIFSAVEAGWKSPQIAEDMPELRFAAVLAAVKEAREDLGIDGRFLPNCASRFTASK